MRKSEIDDLLGVMLESHDNVSDLNITCERPLQVEASGELVPVPVEPSIENLTPFQTEIFALNLINHDRRLTEHLLRQGSCDSSYSLPGKARFRVNIFSQRGSFSVVLRKLETNIPTIEELKLPEAFKKMPGEKNGLILLTGATGSGKTTSLAALLNEINGTKSVHVVTLEDPVEYVHPNRKSTFNQRELGLDYDSFASGLRAALRQAPKIILVGEMRDRETAELALKAAETIRWIVGQRLVPKVGGGRWAVHDILANTIRTNEMITNGEMDGKTFYDIQDVGEPYLMMTFDQALLKSYEQGIVTEETAVAYSTRKSIVQRGIDQIKQKRGQKTSDVEGLRLDTD